MKTDKKFYAYLSLAAAETVALFWFSILPSVTVVPTGGLLRSGDLEHFAAYSVYGFLLGMVLRYSRPDGQKNALFVILLPVVIGSFVGGVCETAQFFVPTRTADVFDFLVDLSGSLLGSVIALKFKTAIQF